MLSLRTLLSTLMMASTIASASATTNTATLTITNNADQWLLVYSNEHSLWRFMVNLPPHSTTQLISGSINTTLTPQEWSAPMGAYLYTGKALSSTATNVTFYRTKESMHWHGGASLNLVFPADFVSIQKEDFKDAWADSDCTCNENCPECSGQCASCSCPHQDSKQ